MCRNSFYHIRALRHIQRSINTECANEIACAIINTRLDYCNSLLVGTSQQNILALQRVQNAAVRIVVCAGMYDHISTHLKALHWLPIKHRITFKLSTILYNAIRLHEPAYLAELLVNRPCTRNLRSSDMDLLTVPRRRTITCDRAFSCAAPAAWNNISVFTKSADSLNTFKSRLKTELFLSAYWQYSFFASDSFAILGWQLQLQPPSASAYARLNFWRLWTISVWQSTACFPWKNTNNVYAR